MNESALLLYLLNFLFIGSLPHIFFKQDGLQHIKWWLTAAPFVAGTVLLLAGYFQIWLPITANHPLRRGIEMTAVPFSAASIALIAYALGTHRYPVSLWHQNNDEPQQLVTHGAYARVRHPFYSAFGLTLLGTLILCPHWGTLLTFSYGVTALYLTAAREEKRLLASQFGAQYKAYMQQTGRFIPRWRWIEL